jgi:outer membrane immunogenic protein
MRKVLSLAAVAVILASGGAYAADAIVYSEPAPVAPASFYSWTGGYVGFNLGYGGGKAKHPFSVTDTTGTLASGSLNMNSSGFLGGVQAGWNFQADQIVYGVEADFQGGNVKGETNISANVPGAGALDAAIGTKLNWYGTVRARLGYTATDRFLVYATGGLAYGETKSYAKGDLGGAAFNESVKKTKTGWTVGAGAEYAVTDNWTVKSEYLYTDLGKANVFSDTIGGADVNIDRKFNFHTVRVGFNYKF